MKERTRAIREKTKVLNRLQQEEGLKNIDEQKQLKFELDFLLEQEDIRWKQRVKRH